MAEEQTSNEAFFDEPSSLNKSRSRGDNVRDIVELAGEQLYDIEQATRPGSRFDLKDARGALVELRRLLVEIDDELCERNEDGSRKDDGR